MVASGIQRAVLVDFHSRAVESSFSIPAEHLTAVSILADAVRPSMHKDAVVVSPDLGAVKIAERYAELVNLPVAIIHKSRLSRAELSVQRVVGDVRAREALVVDDMITTGETIEKAVNAPLEAGCSFGNDLPRGLSPPRRLQARRSQNNRTPNYFSQLRVQPFRCGHKLHFLIENSFFLGFVDAPGVASTTISAG